MKAGDPRHGQLKKTHCPQGHPYSSDNLVQRKQGRTCLICHNLHAAESIARARERQKANPAALEPTKTHCRRGHPYDEVNTFVSGGKVRCRACHREYSATARRKRAAGRAATREPAPTLDWSSANASVEPCEFGLCHIYALCDPESGEVRYIGKTKRSLLARLRQHVKDSRNERHRSHLTFWIRSLLRAGQLPTVRLVSTVGEGSWQAAEIACIERYKEFGARLVNTTRGGEGRSAPLPERAKAKLRGRRHTPEARARMSAAAKARRGHPHTPESRAKIAAANRRRVWTPESRVKLAAARRRLVKPEVSMNAHEALPSR
jgi:hypothetical protein